MNVCGLQMYVEYQVSWNVFIDKEEKHRQSSNFVSR